MGKVTSAGLGTQGSDNADRTKLKIVEYYNWFLPVVNLIISGRIGFFGD